MREENCSFFNRYGQALSGFLHHPHAAPPQGGVILCHGMESNKESDKLVLLGRELARRNLLALRFDFACAVESGRFEEITYSGEVEDLQAAFLFMRDRHTGKIAILGSSMGGTAALLFCGESWKRSNGRDSRSTYASRTLRKPAADARAGSGVAQNRVHLLPRTAD